MIDQKIKLTNKPTSANKYTFIFVTYNAVSQTLAADL